jgi:hypothetical protein
MKYNDLESATNKTPKGDGAFKRRLNAVPKALALFAVMALLTISAPAFASEGGSSSYTPGTYGDFAMNILSPGLSIRENVFYTYGTIDDLPPLYGISKVDLEVKGWINLLQAAWTTKDFKLLGGRYFANISIPVGFSLDLTTTIAPPLDGNSSKESESGLGDIQFVPLGLLWDRDNFHFLAAENIITTTGNYDVNKSVNMGRNCWGFDTLFGMTWLDPKKGHEISFTMGYIINQENSKTNYKTGDEFHLDYTLAQYLSEDFGVGVFGYYYKQMSDDSGSGYDDFNGLFGGGLDGYRSTSGGLGPGIMWAPKVGDRPLNLIAKWIYEYEGTNRFMGGWIFVSAAMSF